MKIVLSILVVGLIAGCASSPSTKYYPQPTGVASRPLPPVVEPVVHVEPAPKPKKRKTDRELFEKEPQYVGPAPMPTPGTKLVVDIGNQNFHYYENNEIVRSGPITSGRPGFPTDRGSFTAGLKDKNKRSSLYPKPNGGSPMNYAIQVNGDIFLHEGRMPGYPDSHGCIRLWGDDARFLFKKIKTGDRIDVI